MKTRTKIIIGILFTLSLVIAGILANLQYNYDLDKCSDLNSKESSYDFDLKVETNANYNSNCYYLHNHPLAEAGYYLFAFVMVTLFFAFIVFIIVMLSELRSYSY